MLRSDYTNCIWSENTTIHDAFWDSTDRSFIDVGFLPCTEIIIGIHFCRPFLSSKKWTQHYWPVKEARLLQRLSNAIRKIEQQGKQVWFSYAFSLNINSVKTRYSDLSSLSEKRSKLWDIIHLSCDKIRWTSMLIIDCNSPKNSYGSAQKQLFP